MTTPPIHQLPPYGPPPFAAMLDEYALLLSAALTMRVRTHGVKVDLPKEPEPRPVAPSPAPVPLRARPGIGRNLTCPCGSGRKFKNCCRRMTLN